MTVSSMSLAALVAGAVAAPAAPAQAPPQSPDAGAAPPPVLVGPLPGLTLVAPEKPGYALHRTADGGYWYDEDAWRADVAVDGTVHFTDHNINLKSFRIGPIKPVDNGQPNRPSLQGMFYELSHGHPPPDPWERSRAPLSPYHADPRYACLPRDPCYFVPMGGSEGMIAAGGIADVTDMYMRWMHQDPYRRAKAKFLAATQDLRAKMATRRLAVVLRASLAELPARLAALWDDPARAPVEKRHLLWLLWSETSDDGDGAAARARIERFIRERLPRGSPDAFTDDELARYGAATQGRFAPYGPPP
jgi:hypothetical protein